MKKSGIKTQYCCNAISSFTKNNEKVGVEAKYLKDSKVAALGSFMVSMLGKRAEVNNIFWLFNADGCAHRKNYTKFEYLIYFTEQIADSRTKKYWDAFLKDVACFYIYDKREKGFYECVPSSYKEVAEEWIKVVVENDLGRYFTSSEKSNDRKSSLFEEKVIPKLTKRKIK